MLMSHQFVNALLPLKNSFLAVLEKQLEDDNLENYDSYGEYLGTFPDVLTVDKAWKAGLKEMTSPEHHQPPSPFQANGKAPNILWVHCHFGLFLYHLANGRLPLMTVIRVLVFEQEIATGKKVPGNAITNFPHVVQPDSPSNWEYDIGIRARFLYKNITRKRKDADRN